MFCDCFHNGIYIKRKVWIAQVSQNIDLPTFNGSHQRFSVVSLGAGTLPFAMSSTLMVLVIGGLMMRHARASHWVLLELALLTGFGSQFLFTRVFETILP